MQENSFFKWTARINSILFLLLILLMIGVVLYVYKQTNNMFSSNDVEVIEPNKSKNDNEPKETLRLGTITDVKGNDVRYVRLKSVSHKRGYDENIRNIVFFEGVEMKSHWLFDTDNNKIETIDQLQNSNEKSEERKTVAIYYQIRNEDTNNNGKIDKNDMLKVALTSPNGHDYTVIEKGMTSILDHNIDQEALILTIITESNNALFMKKYSLETKTKISEREITRIGKRN